MVSGIEISIYFPIAALKINQIILGYFLGEWEEERRGKKEEWEKKEEGEKEKGEKGERVGWF